jgi:hypothetical protein
MADLGDVDLSVLTRLIERSVEQVAREHGSPVHERPEKRRGVARG